MSNLREDYLDFKELRESKIKTLITELSKKNKVISRENLLKMLSRKEAKENKDANFFQILDLLVDKNIEKMTEKTLPPDDISELVYRSTTQELQDETGDELTYSPQTYENSPEDNIYIYGGNRGGELVGGGESPPTFRITLREEIPTREEDPFLYSSGMMRIIEESKYINYLDNYDAYLNNRKNIFFEKNIPRFLSITFNRNYSDESATNFFGYGRFVLQGTYFFGYRTSTNLYMIPMNFGWILLRNNGESVNLLAYCRKIMAEKECSPVGNTFEEGAIWKSVQIDDGFIITETDSERNLNIVRRRTLKTIERHKLDKWQHIPDLPKYINITLFDLENITFTYDRIDLNEERFTYGYKCNNLYIISYNNVFYLFEVEGDFPELLQPKMVIYQSLLSPDPNLNRIGYNLDFDETRRHISPDFDFYIVDVRIGIDADSNPFYPIDDVDVDAVSGEVVDYFSSLDEHNLYHLFEMNQCHFQGTSLGLIFDNITDSYGERYYFKKIDFNLGRDVTEEDIYTCYCYMNKNETPYVDGNNCSFYKYIFLYKNNWVLFTLSESYENGRLFIDHATPKYLCPGGSPKANFSYDQWIKIGDQLEEFQPLHPRNEYGGSETPIRFSYNDVRAGLPLPELSSDEIIVRHTEMERYDFNDSNNMYSEIPEKTDEQIENLLDSFLKKGDGGNILADKLPAREDILRGLKIFKKDYSTDKNKDFFYFIQYIASILNFEQNGIGIKNVAENFDEEFITLFLKRTRIESLIFKDKAKTEMGIDAGGLRPEFFRDIVSELKKTFFQMLSEKDERETKEALAFQKIENYVESKLREARKSIKSESRVTRNNTGMVNTNNFFRSKKTRNLYQSIIRTKLANNKRRKQEGKALTKTQRKLIKKKVNKRMDKFNRNVAVLSRRTKKTPKRTLSAPSKVEYGNNLNDFSPMCDLEASNFTLRKYKNNPFKKAGLSIDLAYFLGGIFLGKMLTNDNGTPNDLKIYPNIQMSYFFLHRLMNEDEYLNNWLDILSVCKLDMPDIYDSFKYWDESWNSMNYSVWDDDLPIPKEYYKYLGKPKDLSTIKKEIKRLGQDERLNSYVPDPKFKLSLFLLYVIEKYERGLDEEYYYFLRGMRQMIDLDVDVLKNIDSLDKMFTGGTIDVELLISKIDVSNYGHRGVTQDEVDRAENWLIEIIREMDIAGETDLLKKLLYFWSSSYNVIEEGSYKVNLMDKQDGDGSLITSHTCSKEIDVHRYSSKEIFREKLKTSVLHGQEGFGFA